VYFICTYIFLKYLCRLFKHFMCVAHTHVISIYVDIDKCVYLIYRNKLFIHTYTRFRFTSRALLGCGHWLRHVLAHLVMYRIHQSHTGRLCLDCQPPEDAGRNHREEASGQARFLWRQCQQFQKNSPRKLHKLVFPNYFNTYFANKICTVFSFHLFIV